MNSFFLHFTWIRAKAFTNILIGNIILSFGLSRRRTMYQEGNNHLPIILVSFRCPHPRLPSWSGSFLAVQKNARRRMLPRDAQLCEQALIIENKMPLKMGATGSRLRCTMSGVWSLPASLSFTKAMQHATDVEKEEMKPKIATFSNDLVKTWGNRLGHEFALTILESLVAYISEDTPVNTLETYQIPFYPIWEKEGCCFLISNQTMWG